MTETYKCGAQYRHVLGVSMARLEVDPICLIHYPQAMERLSRRELRDSVELTEILASRRGSRQPSPLFPGKRGYRLLR